MKRAALAFLFYGGLTIALTHPLIFQLGSVLPGDAGDPALNTWILWWNTQAIPYTSHWWNAPAFYPIAGVLAFSETLLGLSIIATPIQWLGAEPQVAYNIVFLLTFPLSGLGAYLLAVEITKRPAFASQSGATARLAHDAAFIAGLLFAFAPYRIGQLTHIQVLAAFPMPFALLGLHRYLRDSRARWLTLFGAGWCLQGICNSHYLVFFSVLVGMWILWFASPWSRPRPFAAIATAWLVAALPLLPILWRYRAIHEVFGFTRDFGTVRHFGADVAGLLRAASALTFWSSLDFYQRPEGELFPGLMIVLVVLAGAIFLRVEQPPRSHAWRRVRQAVLVAGVAATLVSARAAFIGPWAFRPLGIPLFIVANPIKPLTYSLVLLIVLVLTAARVRAACAIRSALGFYAVAAFVLWLFSLGPAPTLMGEPLMYRGPYWLLMFFPGFNALRVPARFWMLTTLCLAVVGAILFDRLAARTMPRVRLVAAMVVALGAIADGWVSHMPLVSAPPIWQAENCDIGATASRALVELPLGDPFGDVAAMYRSMSHGRPVVNGYSGYFPPQYVLLRFGLSRKDPDVLTQLAAHGAADIVVDREKHPDGGWDKYVASHPAAHPICTEGKQTLYRLTDPSAVIGPNLANSERRRRLP